MSFIYPRTISITRPVQVGSVGSLPYGGQVPANETVIISGVPASIQATRGRHADFGQLPGGVERIMYHIFFVQPKGTVRDRDVITDDLGQRYTVVAAYWNSLSYRTVCERLEA